MILQQIAAFSNGTTGGNPAGVLICDGLPEPRVMQKIAADVGYSESVFAAPEDDKWRVRYFAPEVEVDFCGHATIALAAELARQYGSGTFELKLNRADITVEGYHSTDKWEAAFISPPTRSAAAEPELLDEALALFGIDRENLDEHLPPALAHGGGDHLVLALKSRDRLRVMEYDFAMGRELAERANLVTFSLVHAESPRLYHARNPFPLGGVVEDPATGAAAAALAGYLRDLGHLQDGTIVIHQGDDMGIPCLLKAEITPGKGAGIKVSGSAREIAEPHEVG